MTELHPNLLAWALDEDMIGDRMALIAGPRQVGKTTHLQKFLHNLGLSGLYFNWDEPHVRSAYRQDPDFFSGQAVLPKSPLPLPVVFDELHKMPRWKNILKGLHDHWKGRFRFIVTGSARLDFMRRSGDSLVGRYFLYRRLPLHPRECIPGCEEIPPWSPREIFVPPEESTAVWREAVEQLSRLNGFPEPFLKGTQKFLNRWQLDHLTLLITEDLADLSRIDQILKVEELAERLRNRVGSPLSTNGLAEDLQAGFPTVKRWLEALELVYLTFRLLPYHRKLERSLRKEPKLYFWDWSLPQSESSRFENMVAVYLMRAVCSWNERGLGQYELYYVRTRDGQETDFLILDKARPVLLVEAKMAVTTVDPSLIKFKNTLSVPLAIQVTDRKDFLIPHRESGVWIMGIDRFLTMTP